eukprot:410707-Amphidinium_carterae.1
MKSNNIDNGTDPRQGDHNFHKPLEYAINNHINNYIYNDSSRMLPTTSAISIKTIPSLRLRVF